jgi:hypothetical protein
LSLLQGPAFQHEAAQPFDGPHLIAPNRYEKVRSLFARSRRGQGDTGLVAAVETQPCIMSGTTPIRGFARSRQVDDRTLLDGSGRSTGRSDPAPARVCRRSRR